MTVEPYWVPDPEWPTANRAEHAIVGEYELVAYDLPDNGVAPRLIGWEIFTGPKFMTPVASDVAESFEAAKQEAAGFWRDLISIELASRFFKPTGRDGQRRR
jgi:hypothetical protein